MAEVLEQARVGVRQEKHVLYMRQEVRGEEEELHTGHRK